MCTELTVIPSSALTEQEQADLNASIDSIIAAHKNNRQEINRLVFESVSAMTDSEGYEQELSNRKGLRRFWGAITGMVSFSASSLALCRLCPATSS